MAARRRDGCRIDALGRAERSSANQGTGNAHRRLDRRDRPVAAVEEALVAVAIADGEDVQRSPSAPPQAALQVRVAEAVKSSRAA
jgi:hypothetical protein